MHDPSLPAAPVDGVRYALAPMTAERADAVARWRYPPPYERYGAPEAADGRFRAVLRDGALCGFVQWFPLAAEDGGAVVRLGLGMRPDLCGRGEGAAFVRFLAEETARLHPGAAIDLEVAAGNVRAVRAYERAGFRVEDAYELPLRGGGVEPVVNMVWAGGEPER